MALKLNERYPQRWDSPSNDYPQGAFKNLTELGEQDGSYLEQDWLNDYSGFFGALLRNAEMTPDGNVDTAQRSQFYDALVAVAKKAVGGEIDKKRDITDGNFNTAINLSRVDNYPTLYFDNNYGSLVLQKSTLGEFSVTSRDSSGEVVGRMRLPPTKNGFFASTADIPNILQSTGSSTTSVMSQKAVTDHILLESTPIGAVQAYIGGNAPNDKWLLCRGQAFSAESYPDLAQLLPNLKVPDLRGVALRGLDANRGFDPGRALLSYQEDAMQKITGSAGEFQLFANRWANGVFTQKVGSARGMAEGASGTGHGTMILDFDSSLQARTNTQNETVMKNVAVNFIIKAR